LSSDDVGRVWGQDEEGRAWSGSPDIIGVANGKLTLADLKTSVKPYSQQMAKGFGEGLPRVA
jgi:hypothetical protein